MSRLNRLPPKYRSSPVNASENAIFSGKPAPDLFLHAALVMGARPARTLVIEDSVPGVQAAVRAGMAVIGYAGGSHVAPGHDARLAENGARVLADMRDLAVAVEQLA